MQHSLTKINKSVTFSLLALLILLILTTCIYWPGLNGPLALDDHTNIELASIDNFDAKNLSKAVQKSQSGIHFLTRAIPTLSLSINTLNDKLNSHQLKLQNLILHLLCGFFIFIFLYFYTSAFTPNKTKALSIGLLTSGFWLLHPLHVSTTLYVIQRIAQFSTLFTLISLCVFLYARSSSNSYKKAGLYFLLYPLIMLLGLMSKENSALLCLYVITISITTRNSTQWNYNKIDHIFYIFFGWIILAFGIILFLYKFPSLINYASRDFTLFERALSEIHIVIGYAKNLLIPDLSSMGLFLDDTPIQKHFDLPTATKLATLFGTIAIASFWLFERKFSSILLLFFLGHLLESTILPLELAFEHRNYFSSVAIFACIAWAITSLNNKKITFIIASTLLIGYASLLTVRVGFWSNEHEWQKTNLAYHPLSLRTHISYKDYLEKHFGISEAIAHIRDAQQLLPDSAQLPIIELGYFCIQKTEETEKINDAIIKLRRLMETSTLSIQIENSLYQLAELIEVHRCSHINTQSIFDMVNTLIIDSKSKRIYPGNLYAARALLFHAAGHSLNAHLDFVTAYRKTGKVGHLIPAAETLISNADTRNKGFAFIQDINNGKYFDIKLYNTAHKKVNLLLDEYVDN